MIIDNIEMFPHPTIPRRKLLHVEIGGNTFTGSFDYNLPSFLTCIGEMGKFFAVKAGRMKESEAGLTKRLN